MTLARIPEAGTRIEVEHTTGPRGRTHFATVVGTVITSDRVLVTLDVDGRERRIHRTRVIRVRPAGPTLVILED